LAQQGEGWFWPNSQCNDVMQPISPCIGTTGLWGKHDATCRDVSWMRDRLGFDTRHTASIDIRWKQATEIGVLLLSLQNPPSFASELKWADYVRPFLCAICLKVLQRRRDGVFSSPQLPKIGVTMPLTRPRKGGVVVVEKMALLFNTDIELKIHTQKYGVDALPREKVANAYINTCASTRTILKNRLSTSIAEKRRTSSISRRFSVSKKQSCNHSEIDVDATMLTPASPIFVSHRAISAGLRPLHKSFT